MCAEGGRRTQQQPHKALKANLQLIQAGVPPIPVKAYLWSCEHITGARVSTLTETDLLRKLLSVGNGSISNGRVKFEKRSYEPVDRAALFLASNSTARPKAVEVHYDKTFREELHVVTSTGGWSHWGMTDSDRRALMGSSLLEGIHIGTARPEARFGGPAILEIGSEVKHFAFELECGSNRRAHA